MALKDAAPRHVNQFFREFYEHGGSSLRSVEGHEHTGQVPPEKREVRGKDFRAGKLPILFCSPTMELGVDISALNAVYLRNVPPTPAN